MTVAVDMSGRVVGQVLDTRPFVESTRYALTQDDVDNGPRVFLFGSRGYFNVPRESVRLEETE